MTEAKKVEEKEIAGLVVGRIGSTICASIVSLDSKKSFPLAAIHKDIEHIDPELFQRWSDMVVEIARAILKDRGVENVEFFESH